MRRRFAVAAIAPMLLLAGCTPTVSLEAGPQATSVACAGVIVRVPDALGSAAKRDTNSQGTAAWGQPPSVSLICGVPQPTPTDTCIEVSGVDWDEVDLPNPQHATQYVLTTHGRTPRVRVVIEAKLISSQDVLPALSEAVQDAIPRVSSQCPNVVTPSATPTPSPTATR